MKKSYPTYKSHIFAGKIEKDKEGRNKFVFNTTLLYKLFIDRFTKPGDEISVTLTTKQPKRTVLQNNFYWLYLSLIALPSGHTAKEIHDWAKGKFLSTGITEIFGDKTRKVKSTTDLTRPEFCEYLLRIEETTGVLIPATEPFLKPLSPAEYNKLKESQKVAYEKMKSRLFLKQ